MKKVLILQNAPHFSGGHFESELVRRNIAFEYHKVFEAGAPELKRADQYSGFLVLGGPLSFHVDKIDSSPALSRQVFFLRKALELHKPVFAVSQGACLLAQAQGAWVERAPASEVGWIQAEVYPDYSRNSVLYSKIDERRFPALVWYDSFHGFPPQGYWYALGPNCRYLSTGIHGNCYLFNFHPEVTPELLETWLRHHEGEIGNPEEFRAKSAEGLEFARGFSRKIIHAFESFLK